MNAQKSYFTILPAPVRYSEKIKASEKIFYSEIASLCNEKGYCTTSNSYFAELYNVNKATISQYLHSLQKAGFIICKIDKANGNNRKIYLCDLIGLK
ncbi:helix-turn-helix domain-containing protein [Planktosalinus lacus]|uniref:helix-turn-helix domain-containing protein n=1 Tax=Planktosalinus lacus TaxID=1526573 RepID=UPI001663B17D